MSLFIKYSHKYWKLNRFFSCKLSKLIKLFSDEKMTNVQYIYMLSIIKCCQSISNSLNWEEFLDVHLWLANCGPDVRGAAQGVWEVAPFPTGLWHSFVVHFHGQAILASAQSMLSCTPQAALASFIRVFSFDCLTEVCLLLMCGEPAFHCP